MDEALRQLMLRMQLQQMMGGNQQYAPQRVDFDPFGPSGEDYYQLRQRAYQDWTKQAPVEEIMDAGPFEMRPREPSAVPRVPSDSALLEPGFEEGWVMPMTEMAQRGYDTLLHEHAMEGTQHQRDQELSDALNRDRGRYVRLPEEYGGASVYEGPMQRISAAGGGGDPVSQLMLQMQLQSMLGNSGGATPVGQSDYDARRRQAMEQWSRTAPHEELMDYLRSANERTAQQLQLGELQQKAGPSYAEGELMPMSPAQRLTGQTHRMEREAHEQAGEPDREDALRNALHWKAQGYYAPNNNPSMPPPTIGDLAPRPGNQFQSEIQGGAPISDVRGDPVTQLMLQMQLRSLMAGNRGPF